MTTTNNFAYALPNILLHHPSVMRELQREVDDVIGDSRVPSIFDRNSMPYTSATIYELLRYTSLVPTLSHSALESASLANHLVPAGTVIVPLFAALHHDGKFWGDPKLFDPSDFSMKKVAFIRPNIRFASTSCSSEWERGLA